jgi:toxin ParE1/3/4
LKYRLTAKAEQDILHIFVEGARLFGVELAEQYHWELDAVFNLIAANPRLARERVEITPPVRIHPHKSHIVIYLADKSGEVLIVRVRHAHEDWERDPF